MVRAQALIFSYCPLANCPYIYHHQSKELQKIYSGIVCICEYIYCADRLRTLELSRFLAEPKIFAPGHVYITLLLNSPTIHYALLGK